jgi:pyruvate,water dikinase
MGMAMEYIFDLKKAKGRHNIGSKAGNLGFLASKGFSIPRTHVCTWDAYARYLAGDATLMGALKTEISIELDISRRHAVRSSANLEDDLDTSFAGQFTSLLNVQGLDGLLSAIRSIWDTSQSPKVQAYLKKHGIDPGHLRMGIVIQEMISPQISGVSFSRNPMTGLDEVIVEAVRGSGEALVQDGVTPFRWISKWGTWIEEAREGDIELALIEEVVQQTKSIARAYGRPVDLEWVYDGHRLNWVQLRAITSLDTPIYSNRISNEVFPGIIKPLIWSVNVPLVNGAWVALFTELIGANDIEPESLAGYFYYRAYFNMAALGEIFELLGLPRETLELLMGIEVEGPERPSFKPTAKTYTLMPRMLRFGVDKVAFARRVDAFLPSMENNLQAFDRDLVSTLGERELLDEIDRLYPLAQETAYYNIVIPLLMQIYNRILKAQLGRLDVDYESFDLTGDMEELQQFEPNAHLDRLNRRYNALDPELRARIRDSSYQEFLELPGIDPLQRGVVEFLQRFGHLSDSGNDFSHKPWRENPDLVLQMITDYTRVQAHTSTMVGVEELPLSAWRGLLFKPLYRRARRYRWYREAVSSMYTYGYGLFRDYFLALGDHFVRRGAILQRDDIFFLYLDEVREIVEDGEAGSRYCELVEARRREIDQARDIVPPSIIYGDQAPPVDAGSSDSLKGIPTSRGHYTGPVKVLKGIQDFEKLGEGDVLVIPYSDVGWTPLFTKAGAVVAESGGILSHSSIVAREYGIPAVVSVPGACRLEDNIVVTVDGYRGEIVLHNPSGG